MSIEDDDQASARVCIAFDNLQLGPFRSGEECGCPIYQMERAMLLASTGVEWNDCLDALLSELGGNPASYKYTDFVADNTTENRRYAYAALQRAAARFGIEVVDAQECEAYERNDLRRGGA